MKHLRILATLIFAAAVGAMLGDAAHTRQASATTLGVLMQCTAATGSFNGSGTLLSVTQTCTQASGDVSGLTGVTLTFTAPTQRYTLGTTGTVTLP